MLATEFLPGISWWTVYIKLDKKGQLEVEQ